MRLPRLALTCWLALCVVVAVAAALRFQSSDTQNEGWALNADLRQLAPRLALHPATEAALDALTQHASQGLVVALQHPDEWQLEDAVYAFEDALSELNGLTLGSEEQALSAYRAFLLTHRFRMLNDAQWATLQSIDDATLVKRARQRLFSAASAMQLYSVEEDPFGLLNDYALAALEALSAQQAPADLTESMYVQILNVRLRDTSMSLDAQRAAIEELEAVMEAMRSADPQLSLQYSGVPRFTVDAAQEAERDIRRISMISGLGIVLLLLGILRHPAALLLPALSIGFGGLCAFVACQYLFAQVHVLAMVFGASLVGVVVDYSLHFIYCQHGSPARQSALYRALALSLLTSVLGYFALMFSGLQALQQVAAFSVIGLACGWLCVIALGPLLFRRAIEPRDHWLRARIASGLRGAQQIPKILVFMTAALIIVSALASLTRIAHFSDSPRHFFNANPALLEAEQAVQSLSDGLEPATFILASAEDASDLYRKLTTLQAAYPEAKKLLGLPNLLPAPERQDDAYERYQVLFREGGAASQLLRSLDQRPPEAEWQQALSQNWVRSGYAELLEQMGPPFDVLWQADSQEVRSLLFLPKGMNLSALGDAVAQVPGLTLLSVIEENTAALRVLRERALWLLALACGLAAMLSLTRYRHPRAALVPLSAIAVVLLVLSFAQIPISVFHVMALYLVLGLGMDYVIFVEEMARGDGDKAKTMTHTMVAIVLSAATSLLSFGLLSLSSMPVIQAFGLTVLIGNSVNLIGAFWLAGRAAYSATPRSVGA